MQIVIDISDFIYNGIRNITEGKGIIEYNAKALYNAIYYGIPLPDGHGRLIDADMLEKKVEKHREMLKISEYDRELVLHYTDIEMAPTIIEADKEVEK